jgi:GxxExxY protein
MATHRPDIGGSGHQVAVNEMKADKISETIIGAAYAVSNALGCGFLEKVYENALVHELRKRGLQAEHQYPIKITYDGVIVGDYLADILVNDQVIVELKAAKALDDIHVAQCINYLKATKLKLCLLINFGNAKVEARRIAN